MKGAEKLKILSKKSCMWHFSATRPLSATPRWEFVVHSNSTQELHTNTTKVVHSSVVHTNSTKVLLTNSTKVVQMNITKVLHMNCTKVLHTNSVHGKVVTDSGVATNSTLHAVT